MTMRPPSASIGTTPASSLPSVLLPAPFSPHSAWQLPAATSKLTPSSASTPGNRLVTPSKRRKLTRSRRHVTSFELQVFLGHVAEAPLAELARPGAEVLLGDAHELHGDGVGDRLSEHHVIDDDLDALVAPQVRRLREQHGGQPL